MMEALAQAVIDAAREAAFSGLVEKFRTLAAKLAELHQRGDVDDLTQWATHGALAALESALSSKDEIEARNISALVLLAFNVED
ncbi:MAG: hypothetical protein LM522_06155 [Candidatus Contendobacter sp.]|nr:hypothetical protein [Candidatus Contendobacter sp.]